MRFFGMFTTSLVSTSPSARSLIERATASFRVSRASRMKRCRLVWLFPFGLSRRSTMFMPMPLSGTLARLVHAHVPLDQTPRLPRRIAAAQHARDELRMLLLGFLVALGGEADDRQQVLDLREHALLDDLADLLVGGPGRVLALVLGARPQGEFHHLVAEVLGVGDARRLLDLRQLLVQHLAVEQLAGVGILEVLVLDPGVGVGNVAVEQVLAVVAVALDLGLLDLVADELGVARRQLALDEVDVLLLGGLRELRAAD